MWHCSSKGLIVDIVWISVFKLGMEYQCDYMDQVCHKKQAKITSLNFLPPISAVGVIESVWVCETYVVHYPNGKDYVVHHWPALCTITLHCAPFSGAQMILHVNYGPLPRCTIGCCQSGCVWALPWPNRLTVNVRENQTTWELGPQQSGMLLGWVTRPCTQPVQVNEL